MFPKRRHHLALIVALTAAVSTAACTADNPAPPPTSADKSWLFPPSADDARMPNPCKLLKLQEIDKAGSKGFRAPDVTTRLEPVWEPDEYRQSFFQSCQLTQGDASNEPLRIVNIEVERFDDTNKATEGYKQATRSALDLDTYQGAVRQTPNGVGDATTLAHNTSERVGVVIVRKDKQVLSIKLSGLSFTNDPAKTLISLAKAATSRLSTPAANAKAPKGDLYANLVSNPCRLLTESDIKAVVDTDMRGLPTGTPSVAARTKFGKSFFRNCGVEVDSGDQRAQGDGIQIEVGQFDNATNAAKGYEAMVADRTGKRQTVDRIGDATTLIANSGGGWIIVHKGKQVLSIGTAGLTTSDSNAKALSSLAQAAAARLKG